MRASVVGGGVALAVLTVGAWACTGVVSLGRPGDGGTDGAVSQHGSSSSGAASRRDSGVDAVTAQKDSSASKADGSPTDADAHS